MAQFEKIAALAGQMAEAFETVKRHDDASKALHRDGVDVVSIKDSERERWQAVCMEAHDNGGFFPDDWRYSMIDDAASLLAECEDEDEWERRIDETEAPIYNHTLLAYIASHGHRFNGYADEVLSEYGGDLRDFMQIPALAWHMEWREVCAQVFQSLSEMADAEEEAAS